MNYQEIKNLRKKIETDPILTDEEIEYIWMAMDKQDVQNPMKSKNGTDYINGLGWCQICDRKTAQTTLMVLVGAKYVIRV